MLQALESSQDEYLSAVQAFNAIGIDCSASSAERLIDRWLPFVDVGGKMGERAARLCRAASAVIRKHDTSFTALDAVLD